MSDTTNARDSESEVLKMRDLEDLETKSGTETMEPDPSDNNNDDDGNGQCRKRKRYQRHTQSQVQGLEAFFKECPKPDIKQRQKLSQELGLEPLQVKFWFQNKRTHMKAQHERHDSTLLKAENKRLREENTWYKEALDSVTCPNCNGPSTFGERSFEAQHLKIENTRLKNELDRVSAITSKYDGKSLASNDPHLPPHLSFLSPDQFPAQSSHVGQTYGEINFTGSVSMPSEERGMYHRELSYFDDELNALTNQVDVDEALKL